MTIPRYEWQPTTAEIAARAGIARNEVIRFDHNTAPFPPEWAAEAAAVSAPGLNEYPGADYRPLREAAASLTGLEPAQIVPGAGIDELILLCGRAFLGPGERAAAATPTYPLYRIATAQAGATLREVAAHPPAFAFPEAGITSVARQIDLLWLCLPNNPTGTTAEWAQVETAVAACDGIVVIDAAYAEFTDDDWTEAVRRFQNVVVLRTLSKAFGLAGARVGFAMAHRALIDRIDSLRPPGSISSVSADLAVLALQRPDRMRRNVTDLVAARDDLVEKLSGFGWDPVPSATNFLLLEVGSAATDLASRLMERGFVVRTFDYAPLEDYLRITVRTPSQHDRLVAELERILT
ncbi:MAG: pyridoxal phosphate-dependent aminotransferase [Acidimicrobiia bacterium]